MKREIKFRAWNTRNNTMYEIDRLEWGSDVLMWGKDEFNPLAGSVLMQYTGLNDKNGKEIYEGDVVRIPEGYGGDSHYKEANGIVKYEGAGFWVESYNWSDYSWHELEIIGNIYENPELLQQ